MMFIWNYVSHYIYGVVLSMCIQGVGVGLNRVVPLFTKWLAMFVTYYSCVDPYLLHLLW
jgi:hypothetical protein